MPLMGAGDIVCLLVCYTHKDFLQLLDSIPAFVVPMHLLETLDRFRCVHVDLNLIYYCTCTELIFELKSPNANHVSDDDIGKA